MSAIIRPSKSAWLPFDQIDLPDSGRPYNATDVAALVSSIRTIGLQVPLTVVERNARYLLIAGRHRLEAIRVIGAERVPVRVVDFDDIEARLWTISENLHRTELTALQRAEQIEEWRKLTAEKKGAQVGPPSGGKQPHDMSVKSTARDLGVPKQEVQRSQTIASLPDEVKAVARERGLDDNQSALLQAAKAPTPQAQIEALERRAERPSQPTAKPLHNLKNLAAGELARWIKTTTPNNRPHVIRVLEEAAQILRDEMEFAAPVDGGRRDDYPPRQTPQRT